jgi:hypothetical protein
VYSRELAAGVKPVSVFFYRKISVVTPLFLLHASFLEEAQNVAKTTLSINAFLPA